MASAEVRIINKDVIARLEKVMRNIGREMTPELAQGLSKIYANAQARRFQSANATEADSGFGPWKKLEDNYAKWKRKKFASYRGGGKVIGIRTGRLYDAATLKNRDDARQVIQGRTLFISIAVPYAKHFDAARNLSKFGKVTQEKFKSHIEKWISSQVQRGK